MPQTQRKQLTKTKEKALEIKKLTYQSWTTLPTDHF
jgi:hypothetical protein